MRRLVVALIVSLSTAILACGGGGSDSPGPDAGGGPDGSTLCDVAPGSRCVTPDTLERCDGTQLVTESCADQGKLCAPATDGSGGAACLSSGEACGMIDYEGACLGNVIAWCDSSSLMIENCNDSHTQCVYGGQGVGYTCQTQCAMDGVTAEGDCDGNSIKRCLLVDGQYATVITPCGAGTTCDVDDIGGGAACLPNLGCNGVPAAGNCADTVLTRCAQGTPMTQDCASSGQVCTYGGDVGFTCAAAGQSGADRASGTISYEDRPQLVNGTLGAAVNTAAGFVTVAIIDDTSGNVLAAGVAAADGSYSLSYDATAGAEVHVMAVTVSTDPGHPLRVLSADGRLHAFGGASFAAAADTAANVLVTEASGEGEAFNIFADTYAAQTLIATDLGPPIILHVVWAPAASNGTYYVDGDHVIYLLGDPADDDGYDDTVILHETGHYIEETQGHSDNPGGNHDGSAASPTLAWSEGFATYFSMVATGRPIYIDTSLAGGWSQNSDTDVTVAPMPAGPMSQNVSENMVTEILWDMGDAPAVDDDNVAGTHAKVLEVQRDWLRTGHGARGVAGVDLVDWLDGWFTANGTSACGGVHDIVTTKRKFPYDYQPAGGSCL